ncbi:MAG: RNA-binding S4 domain-containing protein [Lachnospiraceae bacterium]|nr:RNA-binding S4 domain-containing protein [Lachnospiraceae bacterium]
MRIDKFLKVSRLIKRRTVAQEACEAGRVMINGKTAKASSKVAPGDVLEIAFGDRIVKAEVLELKDTTRKDEAAELYRLVAD